MADPVPLTITHAGHLGMPDIDFPWPAKALILCVVLAPVILFFRSRHEQGLKAFRIYLAAACAAIIAANLITWGWPTAEKFREGLAEWWWDMSYPVVVLGTGFATVMTVLGWLSRLVWKPSLKREAS